MEKKLNFVVSKTPLRISFLGGGTDIPYFYRNFEGSTFSTAIDKFVYVTIKRHTNYFIEKYRLNYHESENCQSVESIKNSIIRETIKFFKIKTPLYISIISDVPTGTGLGGSSSFLVGLINALCKLENIRLTKKKIFELAVHIELDILKKPMGKQDHIPAVYGGLSYSVYKKNEDVIIKKFKTNISKIPMNIFWTKKTREANKLLKVQKEKLSYNIENLQLMRDITNKYCKNVFKENYLNINELIKALNKNWALKKSLNSEITFPVADKFINNMTKKSLGAKILGAGGGGFILILGRIDKNFLKKNFGKMINEKINISNDGSKILIAQ